MTSRLREILTKEEYALFMRTGSLYDEEQKPEPVRRIPVADMWGDFVPRVIPVVTERKVGRLPGDLDPLKGLVSMYADEKRERIQARERLRFERTVQSTPLVEKKSVVRPNLGCQVVSAKDDGYCYLDVVQAERHLAVAALMGEWPSLKKLFTLPGSVIVGGDVLAVLTCHVSKGKIHVGSRRVREGEHEVSFLTLLAGLPDNVLPDWASEVLFGHDIEPGAIDVSHTMLVGGEGVTSKGANVDASYELLFREDRLGQVQQYLGSCASLSSVLAYPPNFYKSNIVELGFTVIGGVVRIVGVGEGTRLFVLLRMVLTELADLSTYPVLRLVKSQKLDVTSLGLKLGAFPTGGQRIRVAGDTSVQRMGVVVERLIRGLEEFEAVVVQRSMKAQVEVMISMGKRVEALGMEEFWKQVADELRSDESCYPEEVVSRYQDYVRIFDRWFRGVVVGYVSSLLLMEYGPRGSYVVRVVHELLSYLGVSRMDVVKIEEKGMMVRVAEYCVFIPIVSPWPRVMSGLPLVGLCAECGMEHHVLKVADRFVCVSERNDVLAVNLDEHMRGVYQLYGPPVINL